MEEHQPFIKSSQIYTVGRMVHDVDDDASRPGPEYVQRTERCSCKSLPSRPRSFRAKNLYIPLYIKYFGGRKNV